MQTELQDTTKNLSFASWQNSNREVNRPFENDYNLIATADELDKLVPILMSFSKIGVDIEQSYLKSYEGFVCLIQLSTIQHNYLIDVLAIEKDKIKSCLGQLFSSPNIIKVFYSGQQDLLWLQRDFGLFVLNYCDVRECANFIDKTADNSLIALLEKYCNHHSDKANKKQMQVSDWQMRPLEPKQLEYAALDAHFLVFIRQELMSKIIQTVGFKRTISFLQQMQAQTTKIYAPREFEQKVQFENFFKLQKGTNLELNILKELEKDENELKIISSLYVRVAKIRDSYAKEANGNPISYLTDQEMYSIVQIAFDANENSLKRVEVIDWEHFREGETKNLLKEFIDKKGTDIQETINIWDKSAEEKQKAINESDKYLQAKSGGHLDKLQRKEKRAQQFESQFSLKKEPYGKHQILSPSGLKLCNCDEKKVQWYLQRKLATLVSTNPFVIKLNFQPNGMDQEKLDEEIQLKENYFYASKRECVCVVCGKEDNLTKYHIIPSVYRTHFPNRYKSHRSHDILLLCIKCHQKSGKHSDILKDKLQQQYAIQKPQPKKQCTIKYFVQRLNVSIKDYLKNKAKMQKENKGKCKETIRKYFEELSALPIIQELYPHLIGDTIPLTKSGKLKIGEKLQGICKKIEPELKKEKEEQNERLLMGKALVDKIDTEEKIIDFIRMWRQHFLDVMKPKYLPPAWDVNHKFQRDFGKGSIFNTEAENQQKKEEEKECEEDDEKDNRYQSEEEEVKE